MTLQQQTLILTEYVSLRLPAHMLSAAEGEALWQRYGKYVAVDFPSPKTADQWRLTSQGWIGYISLSSRIGLSLQPKVPLQNLFRMIEIVYGLGPLNFSDDLFRCNTLTEFYARLALLLARRIQIRGRSGLYQSYQTRTDELPYVRGKVLLDRVLSAPRANRISCLYQEPTVDIEENRILLWTLWRILRSGFCDEGVYAFVRHLYRTLAGNVTLQPKISSDCLNRSYNRLNEDYRPLHALCRFFLEGSGPGLTVGDHEMLAFLIDMAHLYERFVAAWIVDHTPAGMGVRLQERLHFGSERGHTFSIDVVLYDRQSGQPRAVLDTKYKTPASSPTSGDLAQVVAYATAKGCKDALLVYPVELVSPFDQRIGDVRVRTLSFPLTGDLTHAGEEFQQLAGGR
jgi:5-methylcytosine-specific restriction enzyme subunit McrC